MRIRPAAVLGSLSAIALTAYIGYTRVPAVRNLFPASAPPAIEAAADLPALAPASFVVTATPKPTAKPTARPSMTKIPSSFYADTSRAWNLPTAKPVPTFRPLTPVPSADPRGSSASRSGLSSRTPTPRPVSGLSARTSAPRAAVTRTATPRPAATRTATPRPAATRTATPKPSTYYVINLSSGVFHRAGCSNAHAITQARKKTGYFNRADLIREGYRPCKNCDP